MSKKSLGCPVLGFLLWWLAAVRGDLNFAIERAEREIVPQPLKGDV